MENKKFISYKGEEVSAQEATRRSQESNEQFHPVDSPEAKAALELLDASDPDTDYQPFMSRRRFLKIGGGAMALAGAGLIGQQILSSEELQELDEPHLDDFEDLYSDYGPEEKAVIKNFLETRIFELHDSGLVDSMEDVNNFEGLDQIFLEASQFPPGGYDGQLEPGGDNLKTRGDRANYQNNLGADRRSLAELVSLKVVASQLGNNEVQDQISGMITTAIINGIDRRMYEEDQVKNWLSRIESRVASIWQQETTSGDLFLLSHIISSYNGRFYANQLLVDQLDSSEEQYQLPKLTPAEIELIESDKGQEHPVTADGLRWAKVSLPLAELLIVAAPEIWIEDVPEWRKVEYRNNPANGEFNIDKVLTEEEFDQIRRSAVLHQATGGGINVGHLAKLNAWETANTRRIGDAPFWSQTNPGEGYYPDSNTAMEQMGKYLATDLSIPYKDKFSGGQKQREYWQYIPGSVRGNPKVNESGGAVWGQLMPRYLKIFYEKYYQSRELIKDKFNLDLPPLIPGSPLGITLMMALYLNSFFPGRTDVETRDGPGFDPKIYTYKGGAIIPPDIRRQIMSGTKLEGKSSNYIATHTWNPKEDEVMAVTGFGDRYEIITENNH
jgi:hypothetical protein